LVWGERSDSPASVILRTARVRRLAEKTVIPRKKQRDRLPGLKRESGREPRDLSDPISQYYYNCWLWNKTIISYLKLL
jgi:hypothetical protein